MIEEIDDAPVDECSLYQQFLAEREEVMKHKWIKSEEAGHDVGLETALVDWAIHHREEWKREFQNRCRSQT